MLHAQIDDIKRSLRDLLKVDVDIVDLNVKGLNWGDAEVRGAPCLVRALRALNSARQ